MKLNKQIKNKQSEWFEKITKESIRTIYIPKPIFSKLELKNNDEISVEIKSGTQIIKYPIRVFERMTNDKSFSFNLPAKFRKSLSKEIKIKITKLKKLDKYILINNNQIKKIKIKDFLLTSWLDKNKAVIWEKPTNIRTKDPIIVSYPLKINKELLIYLGLYFCDGNKTAYYRLYTSTKDIYNFSLKCYNSLILNQNLKTGINYDKFNKDKKDDKIIKKEIREYWKDVISNIENVNIRIFTRRKYAQKRSNAHLQNGSVYIYDGKELVREYHTSLINNVLNMGKEELTYFFIGGGLGDIYASLRGRNASFNWLEIATNKKEVLIWKRVCQKMGLSYKEKIKEGQRTILCINGYYKIINLLNKGLFSHYNKRKNRCVFGLKNRTETYILSSLNKSINKNIKISGEFFKKASSLLYRNKGGDLIKYNLAAIKNNYIYLTKKGERFINKLENTGIIQVD